MSERRTRRQAALAAANDTPTKPDVQGEINGNGNTHVSAASHTGNGPVENVFLFWPNLIGQ
jgi:CDP-diacylglycerol--inositol 3-phosphatidyltransferase